MDIKFGWCYRKKSEKKNMKTNYKNQIFKNKIKKINFIKRSKKIQSQLVLTFKTYGLIKKTNG